MEKKQLFGYVLALLMAVALVATQCVAVGPNGETNFITIEEMTDQEFTAFQTFTTVSVRMLARPLVESKPEIVKPLRIVVENGRGLISGGSVSLAGLVDKLTENVDNPDVKDFILASLAIIELRGDFPLEDEITGFLSERGVDILGSVLDGIESVFPQEE